MPADGKGPAQQAVTYFGKGWLELYENATKGYVNDGNYTSPMNIVNQKAFGLWYGAQHQNIDKEFLMTVHAIITKELGSNLLNGAAN